MLGKVQKVSLKTFVIIVKGLWPILVLRSRHAYGAPALIFLLLFTTTGCQRPAVDDAAATNSKSQTPIAAFISSRHSDTTDTRNPYRVRARKLAGANVTGGQVEYAVTNQQGAKLAEGRVKLQKAEGEESWIADIPAQPAGSTINYYYLFNTETGETARHPARDSTSYRFRVAALRLVSVNFPQDIKSQGRHTITLNVESASTPSGEMVIRLFPSGDNQGERRVALSTEEQPGAEGQPVTYLMKVDLPDLQAGQIADLYFQLHGAQGAELKSPADAPARTYSIKNSAQRIQSLTGDGAFVLDTGLFQRQRYFGLKGGGVWLEESEESAAHWGIGQGIFSGIARFVLADNVSGHLYVGTDDGVTAIEPGGNSWAAVTPVRTTSGANEFPFLKRLGGERRAGPGAISTLDGTVLFQLQAGGVTEANYPTAVFLQLRDDRLSEWVAPNVSTSLAGLSSMTFDAVEGCWLVGGLNFDSNGRMRSSVIRRCGDSVERIPLQDITSNQLRAAPARIIALTREPSSGGLVAALEFATVNRGEQQTNYGLYKVEEPSGNLSPLTTDAANMGVEITSLATDYRRGRILIGTFGRGLYQFQNGSIQNLAYANALPSNITTIRIDMETGAILVGTSKGAFELSGDAYGKLPFGPKGEGTVLDDALPMDQSTRRVLLSSYSSGLIQLEPDGGGRWRVVDSLKPGAELPAGNLGEARYNTRGGICAILHSQGLLLVNNRQATILGRAEGLNDLNLLQILVRRSGQIWVAHMPLPFGASANSVLQIVEGNRAVRTFEISNRELATIGRWIEVPERDSIFAATRAGVLEIGRDGSLKLLSTDAVSSISRDPRTGNVAVVGTVVQRWDGKRFVPILFRVDHPRLSRGEFQPGAPIDVAIGKNGIWYLLYKGGVIALLDSAGNFLRLLDVEDGIQPTASRLLLDSETGHLFVGSRSEGLVVIFW